MKLLSSYEMKKDVLLCILTTPAGFTFVAYVDMYKRFDATISDDELK